MEFLDLEDEYEEEAYWALTGLQICEQGDCREPRRGPFVTFNSAVICWPCFQEYELGLDPNDIESGLGQTAFTEDYGSGTK